MADPFIGPTPNSTRRSTGILGSMFDGAVKGDFSRNESRTKAVTQIGVGLISVVGQIADFRDTAAAVRDIRGGKSGAWGNLGFALIGWVPAAGDFVKSARKVGVKQTLSSIGDALSSIRGTWSRLWSEKEERTGEVGLFFYKPSLQMDSEALDSSVYGLTNRVGDVQVAAGLDEKTKQLTLHHELVHSFLSPKLNLGQEFRANVRALGYMESHLLRRVEEGLAEAWAKFRTEGLAGVAEGWRFPLEHAYGIDLERMKVERNLLLGGTTSVLAAGKATGDRFSADVRQSDGDETVRRGK